MKNQTKAPYTEVQTLKIPVMRIILGAATAVAVVPFFWNLFMGNGSEETLYTGLLLIGVFAFAWWLVEGSRIYTRVTSQGIGYRFYPLQFRERFARWEELKEIYIREYSALGEYGGWGLRWGFGRGWGYVAGGDWGIQLIYKSGKKRFISTQNCKALKASIEQHAPSALVC